MSLESYYRKELERERDKVEKLRGAIMDYATADTQANWKQYQALMQALTDTGEKAEEGRD